MPKVQKFCRSTELVTFNWIRTHYRGWMVYPVVLIHLKAQYIKIILEQWNKSNDCIVISRCLDNKFQTVTYRSSSVKYQYIPVWAHGSIEVSTDMGDNRWELRINNYRTTLAIGLDQVFEEKQIYIRKYQLLLYQKSTNSYGTASYHYQKSSSIIETSIIKGKRVNNGDTIIIRVNGRQLTVYAGKHEKFEELLNVKPMIQGVYRLGVGLFNNEDGITINSYRQM